MDTIVLKKDEHQVLQASECCIDGSQFTNLMGMQCVFNDVNMTGMKIINANLSDMEIEGAQMGGAYIHNVGMPPKGHPQYNATAQMRPILFEDCMLTGTEFRDCNLSSVVIKDCTIKGMTIDGIDVEEAIEAFKKTNSL
jgi:uncharacterized protein YjbI with pentapeptide repeats